MSLELVQYLKNIMILFGLVNIRLFACGFLFNLFRIESIGGNKIAKNGILISLAFFVMPVAMSQPGLPDIVSEVILILIFKEIMIGLLLGFVMMFPVWILEGAASFWDDQRGSLMLTNFNPVSGSESSPLAVLMTMAISAIIFVTPVFYFIMKCIMESYLLFPVTSYFPTLGNDFFFSLIKFISYYFKVMLSIILPIGFAMFLAEAGLAIMNRFNQNLNVFMLAMGIKSAILFFVLFYAFENIVEVLLDGAISPKVGWEYFKGWMSNV